MKMLSVIQPWASLISKQFKPAENRSWPTNIRGPIGIHASKKCSRNDWEDAVDTVALIYKLNFEDAEKRLIEMVGPYEDLPRGVILGTADLVDCTSRPKSPWHFQGNYGFYLENAKEFKTPIPVRGQLGFWDFDLESERDND